MMGGAPSTASPAGSPQGAPISPMTSGHSTGCGAYAGERDSPRGEREKECVFIRSSEFTNSAGAIDTAITQNLAMGAKAAVCFANQNLR